MAQGRKHPLDYNRQHQNPLHRSLNFERHRSWRATCLDEFAQLARIITRWILRLLIVSRIFTTRMSAAQCSLLVS